MQTDNENSSDKEISATNLTNLEVTDSLSMTNLKPLRSETLIESKEVDLKPLRSDNTYDKAFESVSSNSRVEIGHSQYKRHQSTFINPTQSMQLRAELDESTVQTRQLANPEYKASLKNAIRKHYKTPLSKRPKRQ